MDAAVPFFVAGGTVPPGAPSYVGRAADRELFDALLAGEYGYVLNSRQMGKSSLAVRTIARLNEAGVRTAFVDLTRLGATGADPDRWYAGLLMELGRALGLRPQAMAYLKAHAAETPAGRLFGFLADEALGEEPLVVFVDEIDATRTLPFPADDLFAGIRQAWNARATDPRYARLTFCLMGAALPSDLIRDPRMTPFNVGRRVELRDFTTGESAPFAKVVGEAALTRVLHWTGGHPYLTQAVCAYLASPSPSGSSWRGGQGERQEPGETRQSEIGNRESVDALVRSRYLDARARDADGNLADVGRRLLGAGDPNVTDEDRATTLALYGRVLRGKPVADDEANPAAARIKMSGVARVEDGRLKIRNRIYAEAFDARWVRDATPGQELRRQRKAFWKGALRTGLIAVAVVSVVLYFALANARLAREAQTERDGARRERDRANAQTGEALAARQEAETQQIAARRSAATAETRRREAEASKKAALASSQAAILASRKADASARTANLAKDDARQKANLATERGGRLDRELYAFRMSEVQAAWKVGDYVQFKRLLAETAKNPNRGWEWKFWKQREKAIRFASLSAVHSITVIGASDDERWLILEQRSGSEFSTVLCNALSGRVVRSLEAGSQLVDGFPSDPQVAGGQIFWDELHNTVEVHDLARGRTRALFSRPTPFGWVASADGRYLVAYGLKPKKEDYGMNYILESGQDRGTGPSVEIRNAHDGGILRRVYADEAPLPSPYAFFGTLYLSPERRSDGKITGLHEYDLLNGKSGRRYALPDGVSERVQAGYFDHGRRIVAITKEGQVVVFDSNDAVLRKESIPADTQLVSLGRNGHRAIIGTDDVATTLIDFDAPKMLMPSGGTSAWLSVDGRSLYVSDRNLARINLDQAEAAFVVSGEDEVSPYRIGTYGGRVLVESNVSKSREERLPDDYTILSEEGEILQGGSTPETAGAFYSPSGLFYVTLSEKTIELRMVVSKKVILSAPKDFDKTVNVHMVAVSDGGAFAVVFGSDVYSWRSDGTRRPSMRTPTPMTNATTYGTSDTGDATSYTLSPDGRYVTYLSSNETLDVMDLDTGRLVTRRSEPARDYHSTLMLSSDTSELRWTLDGGLLLSGSGVRRLDLQRGTWTVLIPAGAERIQSFDLSPDGKRWVLALAGTDGERVVLRDRATGRDVLTLMEAPKDSRIRVRFIADGKRIAVVAPGALLRIFRSDH